MAIFDCSVGWRSNTGQGKVCGRPRQCHRPSPVSLTGQLLQAYPLGFIRSENALICLYSSGILVLAELWSEADNGLSGFNQGTKSA